MRIAIDSNDLPRATRRNTWRGMLCDTYMGLDCEMPEDFRSVIEGHAVGAHTLTRITSSAHAIDRSKTLIKRDGLELVFFGIVLAGRGTQIQAGREAALEPGVVVVSDSSRPLRTHVADKADIVWLSVPKRPVVERLRGIEDMLAIPLRPSLPVAPLALEFMTGVDEALARDIPADDAERLTTRVLDLLAMNIASDDLWTRPSVHLMPRWPVQ